MLPLSGSHHTAFDRKIRNVMQGLCNIKSAYAGLELS